MHRHCSILRMHRHCSILREHSFNDATGCRTPINYARLAQNKCSLILYRLVRLPDLWCAPAVIGDCCSSMAFCGSAPRTAQLRTHSKRRGSARLTRLWLKWLRPGTVPLDAGAKPTARRLYLTALIPLAKRRSATLAALPTLRFVWRRRS
eukprot:6187488-Pleurochrysis_carterae.AAC.1